MKIFQCVATTRISQKKTADSLQTRSTYNGDKETKTDKTNEENSKKREKSMCTLRKSDRQTDKSKIWVMEKFTVEQTRDAYCRELTTNVKRNDSSFHTDQNEPLVKTF